MRPIGSSSSGGGGGGGRCATLHCRLLFLLWLILLNLFLLLLLLLDGWLLFLLYLSLANLLHWLNLFDLLLSLLLDWFLFLLASLLLLACACSLGRRLSRLGCCRLLSHLALGGGRLCCGG